MPLPRWLPRPTAWASGLALFVFAAVVQKLFAVVTPFLLLLMRHWPRLAWCGVVALWVSPMAGAAAIHGFAGRLLAPAGARQAGGQAASWWAGFVAWATILVVSITMALIVLVLNPPPIVEPDLGWSLLSALRRGVAGPPAAIVWIALASCLYELEMRARSPSARA